jgi:N-acylneuraminate cytidylyltransferase
MRVAIIPARGGSVRIKRKNIRDFIGKPVIQYSIDTAKATGLFDGGIYVSTEDDEIAEVAMKYGAKIIRRPLELAEIGVPDCGTQEVVRHALEEILNLVDPGAHDACCIYATASLMEAEDLRIGFGMLASRITPYVHSVGPDGYDAGQWYWGEVSAFMDRIPLKDMSQHCVVPAERVCDINSDADWHRAEQMYRTLHGI